MAKSKKPITLSRSNIVYPKREEGCYPISETDWQRLKMRLDRVRAPYRWVNSFAFAFIGAAISTFFELINSRQEIDSLCSEPKFWIIIICVIIGLLLLYIDYERSRIIKSNIEDVSMEMTQIENQFTKDSNQDDSNSDK